MRERTCAMDRSARGFAGLLKLKCQSPSIKRTFDLIHYTRVPQIMRTYRSQSMLRGGVYLPPPLTTVPVIRYTLYVERVGSNYEL